jgi:LacI family transcriptional regulator
MGRIAVSLLMRLLDGQRVEALRVELATKLVVRASAARPSAV